MTNATTSKAASTAGLDRNHRNPACTTIAAILLGATALAASSLPASAANLEVNKELMNFLNAHETQRHHALAGKGIIGSQWSITKVQLGRLRAPAVEIKRPKGDYKIISRQGVLLCGDQVHGNPNASVSRRIEFINKVSDSHTTSKSRTVTTGGEVGVEISVGFGIGPVKGDSKITAKVYHEKSHKSGSSTTAVTSKTIKEASEVTLAGVGGKWAVLYARKHKAENIAYTAVFEPVASDLVTFSLKRRGDACMYQHPGYGGGKLCFAPGKSEQKLSRHRFNDEASSVRVTHGLTATFFQKTNFGGKKWKVTGDHPRLHNWLDDGFSSIQVHGPVTKVVKVPYSQIKSHIPVNLRQFKLTGKISADLTGTMDAVIVTKPMKIERFNEFCNLPTGATAKSMPGLSSMPARSGKKSKKSATGMLRVIEVTAAQMKNVKLKAPK